MKKITSIPTRYLWIVVAVFTLSVFVSCKTDELKPQKDEVFQTKWWTTKQIEDNIGKRIFTERFEKEYDFLKRSGLLEHEFCECECVLKELVKNNTDKTSA